MFDELSIELTKNLDKNTKKNNGIFFTPLSIIEKMCKKIFLDRKNDFEYIYRICEPSYGSCQFINYIDQNIENDIDMVGYELNETIFNSTKDMKFVNKIKLIHGDYLNTDIDTKYDLIIGNPPFYVIKKDKIPKEIEKYNKFYTGRANIFILFIIHSIFKLAPKGVLAFILPKNFLNCHYYDGLREYINTNMTITHIEYCHDDDYLETTQETIIFIIRNEKPESNTKFTMTGDYTIFNTPENIKLFNSLYLNTTSIDKMGFSVKVGPLVWNENKDILTDDTNDTRLVYSGDIKDNKFNPQKYRDVSKKNFIKKAGITGPCLLVNRGYGKGKYKFSYCILDIDGEYLIENHLIMIIPKKDMIHEEIISNYNIIIESFNNPKTEKFIENYFANNAINCKELQSIFPIYIN